MSRFIVAAIASLIVAAFAAGPAAAANPHQEGGATGQPGLECGEDDAISEPAGFTDSAGFANAEDHYAGSPDTPSALNGDSHAVSQYDVACFQFTSSGH